MSFVLAATCFYCLITPGTFYIVANWVPGWKILGYVFPQVFLLDILSVIIPRILSHTSQAVTASCVLTLLTRFTVLILRSYRSWFHFRGQSFDFPSAHIVTWQYASDLNRCCPVDRKADISTSRCRYLPNWYHSPKYIIPFTVFCPIVRLESKYSCMVLEVTVSHERTRFLYF